MPMPDFTAIEIATGGRSPWRNPITRITLARFTGGEASAIDDIHVQPRPGSEMLVTDEPAGNAIAISHDLAITRALAFCWSTGRSAPLVFGHMADSLPFLQTAVHRIRGVTIVLPSHLVCLQTFATVCSAHGRFSPESLHLSDIYFGATGIDRYGSEINFAQPVERTIAIGTAYSHLLRLAGWA